MKDNFDLRKYLTENKTRELGNPYIKEGKEPLDENALRNKVREIAASMLEAKKDEENEEALDVDEEMEAEEGGTEEEIDVVDSEEFEEAPVDEPSFDGEAGDVMSHLNQALEAAKALGDEKLIAQLGNTITFVTRQHVVK